MKLPTGNTPKNGLNTPEHIETLDDFHLRSLIDSAPYPVGVYLGPDMIVSIANQAMLDAWGKTNVINKPYREVLPELENSEVLNQLKNVYETGQPYHAKHQPLDLYVDGKLQTYFFNYSFTPVRDRDGKIIGVMNTGADVTDLNVAQLKLAQSEYNFRKLIVDSPIATCLFTGSEMVIDVANDMMIDLWGKGPSIVGKPLREALPELEGQPFFDLIQNVYQTGETFTGHGVEAKLLRHNQLQTYYFDFTYKALRNENGEIYGVMDTALDVTERVLNAKMLQESERKFKNLVIHAPVGICIVSGDSIMVEMVNDKFLEIVGRGREELEFQNLWEVLHEASEVYEPILRQVFEDGIPFSADSHKLLLVRQGREEYIDVNFVYQPLKNEHGQILSVMILAIDVTQQIAARNEIERSEHKFKSVIANAPIGIALFMGRDLIIETFNQTFIDIVGKGDTIKGLPLRDAMPELETEGQPFLKILDDVYTTGVPFHSFGSQVKIMRDGVMKSNYYDITYTPLLDEDNEVYAILDIAIDVTENVLAQKKIKKSEKNLRKTILQAPVAMCILKGPTFIVEIANQRMLEIWGKDATAIIKKPIFIGLPEAKSQGFEELLNSVYNSGKTVNAYEVPTQLPRKNGLETVYLDFVYEAFREADGRISGVMAVATDVTQQVLARKKIEEAEARTRLAIESADLGSYESNLLNNDMVTSDRFNAIWGLEKTISRSELAKYLHPDDVAVREAAHLEAQTTGIVQYEARIIRSDKAIVWIRVKGKIIYDEKNKPITLLGVVQDITEQKQFADQLTRLVGQRTMELHRSNEDLQQFAHVASHDLKEPVRKIKFYSNLIEDQYKDLLPEKGRNHLQKIHTATDRMFAMIEGVLTYSALRASEQEVERIDLNEVFSNIESDLEILINQKQAQVVRGMLPTIEGAPVLIYQLFYNLINNALKFSDVERKPLIVICAESGLLNGKECTRIEIKDNGIGLDANYIDQIFNPFTRLNPKDKFEGTGLGLALCKKITEQHHGTIEATGQNGEGATFTVSLPISQPEKLFRSQQNRD